MEKIPGLLKHKDSERITPDPNIRGAQKAPAAPIASPIIDRPVKRWDNPVKQSTTVASFYQSEHQGGGVSEGAPPALLSLNYAAGENGTLTGETAQTVIYGSSGTEVVAVPGLGYVFELWSDAVATAARTDTNVTANLDVTASFVAE